MFAGRPRDPVTVTPPEGKGGKGRGTLQDSGTGDGAGGSTVAAGVQGRRGPVRDDADTFAFWPWYAPKGVFCKKYSAGAAICPGAQERCKQYKDAPNGSTPAHTEL